MSQSTDVTLKDRISSWKQSKEKSRDAKVNYTNRGFYTQDIENLREVKSRPWDWLPSPEVFLKIEKASRIELLFKRIKLGQICECFVRDKKLRLSSIVFPIMPSASTSTTISTSSLHESPSTLKSSPSPRYVRPCRTQDLECLNIEVLLSHKSKAQFSNLEFHFKILDDCEQGDNIRGVVSAIDYEYRRIWLSLHDEEKSLMPLGKFNSNDYEVRDPDTKSYINSLRKSYDFYNSAYLEELYSMTRINLDDDSFMLKGEENNECNYVEHLRSAQNTEYAHESVKDGVEKFKKGKKAEALLSYTRALEIDGANVDALVARGALYASQEIYDKARRDLEKAYSLNKSHANAGRYLGHIYEMIAKECEAKSEIKEAVLFLKKVSDLGFMRLDLNQHMQQLNELLRKQNIAQENARQHREQRLLSLKEKLVKLVDDEQSPPRSKKSKKSKKSGKSHKRRASSSSSSNNKKSSKSNKDGRRHSHSHSRKRRKKSHSDSSSSDSD